MTSAAHYRRLAGGDRHPDNQTVGGRKARPPRPRGEPVAARLQCLRPTLARIRPGPKSPTDWALRAGPGCRRGLPPSPGKVAPLPGGPGGVPVRPFFSVYNPPDERPPSLARIRASGRNRRSGLGVVRDARQGSRASGGLAAGGRSSDRPSGEGSGVAARRPRVVDRGARVAEGPRKLASGARRSIRAAPPHAWRNPLPAHGRQGRVTLRAMVYGAGSATSDQDSTPATDAAAASTTLILSR